VYNLIDEQDDFILVDKHPGVSVHHQPLEHRHGDAQAEQRLEPGLEQPPREQSAVIWGALDGATSGHNTGLIHQLRSDLQQPSLHPVHRLDKVTSGLLLFAKTTAANRALSLLFQQRQIEKYYVAISARKPKKKQGLIKGDMVPARRGAWKLTTQQQNPALTQFFSQPISGCAQRLFLLRPSTGKTHQLRVALKSLGAAIAGDPLYGDGSKEDGTNGNDASGNDAKCLGDRHIYERTYLHAYALCFHYQGQDYRYLCPPTQGEHFIGETCQQACQHFSEPWALPWPRLPSSHT